MDRYSVIVRWSDEDEVFIALSPEFEGLSAFGDSAEEALEQLKIARSGFIEVMEEDGDPLPAPEKIQSYSGRFQLRLPKGLHQRLAESAAADGVSLNTHIVAQLSERQAVQEIKPKGLFRRVHTRFVPA